jgi:ABC-type lipoprotein export system ATPase subunit
MNSAGFLRVENLRKEFTKRGGALEVLKGISFTLERGEMLGVVGVSGAGKTTLLQILGTLDRATSGSVFPSPAAGV